MTTVNLDTQNPRELLDQLRREPYPISERIYDIVVPVLAHVPITFLMAETSLIYCNLIRWDPIKWLIGAYYFAPTVFSVLTKTLYLFYPSSWSESILRDIEAKPITEETIASYPEEKQAKLRSLLSKIQAFTQKLGIENVKLYHGKKTIIVCNPLAFVLADKSLSLTDDELAVHTTAALMIHRQASMSLLISAATLIAKTAFYFAVKGPFRSKLPYLIIASAIVEIANKKLYDYREHKLTKTLLEHLDTNAGVASVLACWLKHYYALKQKPCGFSWTNICNQIRITPQGNRRDVIPLTDELEFALNFKSPPKASDETSQTPHASASG